MSEEEGKHFCAQNATPKQREIWRNIALIAWIMGMVPSMVAVVTLTGTSMMFAFMVILNTTFLLINCGFCCVHLQTLKRKQIFYLTCLLFMMVILAVIITSMVTVPEDEFQIVGFVGCGLTFISCIAFLVLNILLHIHGPADPVSVDGNLEHVQSENLPNGILTIRYVNNLRGRLQDDSIFQVQAGQILSLPQPGQVASTTQSTQTSQRTRRPSIFGFRTREETEPERERRQSIERLPIQIISNGAHTPQRRDSSISLMSFNSQRRDSSISLMSILRRTSTSSIEYDTASVRCSCYYLPNETTDSDDVPAYSETPTGNITICPLHGENPIPPPSYDNNTSSYNSLCRILGLPEYDEIIKPVILPSMLKDITESSQSDIIPTSTPTTTTRRLLDSSNRTCPLSDRHSNAQVIFETIFETRSERSDSFLSEYNVRESDAETQSINNNSATTEVVAISLPIVPSTSAAITTEAAAATLQTAPSTSAAITTEAAAATLQTAPSTSAAITTETAAATLQTAPSTSAAITTEAAAATLQTAPSTSAAITTEAAAATLQTAPSTSATTTTTAGSLSAASSTSSTAATTETAGNRPIAPSTSSIASTTEAVADGTPAEITTTTAADFTDPIKFSTSKQTA